MLFQNSFYIKKKSKCLASPSYQAVQFPSACLCLHPSITPFPFLVTYTDNLFRKKTTKKKLLVTVALDHAHCVGNKKGCQFELQVEEEIGHKGGSPSTHRSSEESVVCARLSSVTSLSSPGSIVEAAGAFTCRIRFPGIVYPTNPKAASNTCKGRVAQVKFDSVTDAPIKGLIWKSRHQPEAEIVLTRLVPSANIY
ncbi:hypothetical protein AVEN_150060-1 [Araneus ventricosus]|uniref:Uncharacterized protein n=1 Tax=Araneus ventricosus TaxID=182803 RepID=A0A4Y2EU66_ARAVE|nr:hypothetical protein AVEN_150060-1 [Araneus ventricosus]